VTAVYGLARTTADLDVLSVVPNDQLRALAALAGRGSKLHRAHGVYLDIVTVATVPDSYEERLTELYPGRFQHLRVLALDAYDLILAKLTRNADRDRAISSIWRPQGSIRARCVNMSQSQSATT